MIGQYWTEYGLLDVMQRKLVLHTKTERIEITKHIHVDWNNAEEIAKTMYETNERLN